MYHDNLISQDGAFGVGATASSTPDTIFLSICNVSDG